MLSDLAPDQGPSFRDNPQNPRYVTPAIRPTSDWCVNTTDRAEVHNVIRGLRQVIDEFPERFLSARSIS